VLCDVLFCLFVLFWLFLCVSDVWGCLMYPGGGGIGDNWKLAWGRVVCLWIVVFNCQFQHFHAFRPAVGALVLWVCLCLLTWALVGVLVFCLLCLLLDGLRFALMKLTFTLVKGMLNVLLFFNKSGSFFIAPGCGGIEVFFFPSNVGTWEVFPPGLGGCDRVARFFAVRYLCNFSNLWLSRVGFVSVVMCLVVLVESTTNSHYVPLRIPRYFFQMEGRLAIFLAVLFRVDGRFVLVGLEHR